MKCKVDIVVQIAAHSFCYETSGMLGGPVQVIPRVFARLQNYIQE
jgi:hypothetical protein